jgi:hypothetical protein
MNSSQIYAKLLRKLPPRLRAWAEDHEDAIIEHIERAREYSHAPVFRYDARKHADFTPPAYNDDWPHNSDVEMRALDGEWEVRWWGTPNRVYLGSVRVVSERLSGSTEDIEGGVEDAIAFVRKHTKAKPKGRTARIPLADYAASEIQIRKGAADEDDPPEVKAVFVAFDGKALVVPLDVAALYAIHTGLLWLSNVTDDLARERGVSADERKANRAASAGLSTAGLKVTALLKQLGEK